MRPSIPRPTLRPWLWAIVALVVIGMLSTVNNEPLVDVAAASNCCPGTPTPSHTTTATATATATATRLSPAPAPRMLPATGEGGPWTSLPVVGLVSGMLLTLGVVVRRSIQRP